MTGSSEHLQFVSVGPGVRLISRVDSASCFIIHNNATENTELFAATTCTHSAGAAKSGIGVALQVKPFKPDAHLGLGNV
jgi:hypothetical protein